MKKLLVIIALLSLIGCKTSYYEAGDGVLVNVGITVPGDETAQLEVINYVSGHKARVKSPSQIQHESEFSATNTYFWGMIEIKERRKTKLKVDPSCTNKTEMVQK